MTGLTISGMDNYLSKPLTRADRDPAPEDKREIECPVLDRSVLNSLRGLDAGKGNILHDTIDAFLDVVPEQIEGLSAALVTGDVKTVERLAHTLKSSFGIVGGRRMTAVCKILEHTSRDSGLADAPGLVKRIRQDFFDLCSELAAETAGRSSRS